VSETDLQRSIMVALEQMGVWVIRTAVNAKRGKLGVRTGEPGMPDLWTEFGWLEVKLPGNDLDPDQVAWHAKAKERWTRVDTVRSVIEAIQVVAWWEAHPLPMRFRGKKSPIER